MSQIIEYAEIISCSVLFYFLKKHFISQKMTDANVTQMLHISPFSQQKNINIILSDLG